jgi:WD40-like Beta Propeller Repeat
VNLGAPVNTAYEESAPAISSDERSLYFNRSPNGLDPNDPGKVDEDLYSSERKSRNEAWSDPTPLTALNTTFHERNAAVSRDGLLLFFSSNRPGGFGSLDLYVSHLIDDEDESSPSEWSSPSNLGASVNSTSDDVGPAYFRDEEGNAILYFTSNRPGGRGGFDIYASPVGADGAFGVPVLLEELSSTSNDARPAIRADGLELLFQSNRLPSTGLADLWMSTRDTLLEPWGRPINLGSVVNSEFNDRQAALSDDAEALYLASNRPGGLGSEDIWTSTREKHE